jgi:hypothetical protein
MAASPATARRAMTTTERVITEDAAIGMHGTS